MTGKRKGAVAALLTLPAGLALLALAGYGRLLLPRLARYGATDEEVAARLPGDELIPDGAVTTMAATLPAPPERVWPWLVQMGNGRAGWYSWDRLDNGGRPSADRIVPKWQDLKVGDRLAMVPDGSAHFTVELLDAPRTLVLSSDLRLPQGRMTVPEGPLPPVFSTAVWGFHLSPLPGGRTRLVVRTRGEGRPKALAWLADVAFNRPAHFVMQLRQFQNLGARVAGEEGRTAGPTDESPLDVRPSSSAPLP